jgi:hypothetical protein
VLILVVDGRAGKHASPSLLEAGAIVLGSTVNPFGAEGMIACTSTEANGEILMNAYRLLD